MEAGDDGGSGAENVGLSEDGVGAGDGQFGDSEAVMHVAEVDDAESLAR